MEEVVKGGGGRERDLTSFMNPTFGYIYYIKSENELTHNL